MADMNRKHSINTDIREAYFEEEEEGFYSSFSKTRVGAISHLQVFVADAGSASLRFFGNPQAILDEHNKLDQYTQFIIHPYSRFRHYWLIGMLVMMGLHITVVPLGVSFFTEKIYTGAIWITYIVLSDIISITDLLLNFYVGYTDEDMEVIIVDPKQIRNHYLKTWFLLDLIAVLPIEYIFLIQRAVGIIQASSVEYTGSRIFRILKLVRIMGLLRLLRFSSLLRYVKSWEEMHNWNVGMSRFLRLSYWIIVAMLFLHWNACLQYLIVHLQGVPANSWVGLLNLQDESLLVKYSFSIFRALCHMMCLDYGTIGIPTGISELWVVNISTLTGSIMYAILLAQVTAVIANANASKRVYREKFNEYKEFLRHHHIPKELRLRVLDHLAHQFKGKWFNETMILSELSQSLREEVINHNCSSLVAHAPFFKNCDQNFMISLLSKLKFHNCQSDNVIYHEGAVGHYMLFIEKGTMVLEASNFFKKMSDGDFIGEMSLLTDKPREVTVTATTPCRFYTISKTDFNETLELYPMMKEHFERIVAERQEELHESRQTVVQETTTFN